MDKFMKTMEKDVQKDNFTKKEMVVYGVLVPLALVLIMGLAGWIENLLG
jgi:hypothetical protein